MGAGVSIQCMCTVRPFEVWGRAGLLKVGLGWVLIAKGLRYRGSPQVAVFQKTILMSLRI